MTIDCPCFKLLYFIPGKERAIRFFLNMAKATRLNLDEVESLFQLMNNLQPVFGMNSLSEEQINQYYKDAPYTKCSDVKEDLLREMGSLKINPCKMCKYSSSYVNAEHEKEIIVFHYLLSHPDEVENWKLISPKKQFKSQFLYLVFDKNEPRAFQISLYEKLFSLLSNYIISSQDMVAYDNIFDLIYRVKMRFLSIHLKNLHDSSDQLFQQIVTQLENEFAKYDVPSAEQFQKTLQDLTKRKRYTAQTFLPEVFKNLGFDGPTDQNGAPSFLGAIANEPKTVIASDNLKSPIIPYEKQIFTIDDLRLIANHESILTETSDIPIYECPSSVEADALISSEHTEDILTPFLSDTTESVKELLEETETEKEKYDQASNSMFDEYGRVDLSNEVRKYCVIPLHPHDIYSMLPLIGKEQWIGIERAVSGDTEGILVYLGSGRAAYYLETAILDDEILKCLFFYDSIAIISMDACGIFHYLLQYGIYIFPKMTSLTAKYNATFKTNLIFPIAELKELIREEATEFLFSPAIELIQNYYLMSQILGRKMEEYSRHKSEQDYMFFEFALGTSIDISKITGLLLHNLRRKTFFYNEFLYDGLFNKVAVGTICSFQFSFKINNILVPIEQQYKVMAYVISHIFKSRNIWRFKPLLLYYDTERLIIYIQTTSSESLGIIEENVCMHVARQCKFFGMDVPHIIVNT